MSRLFLINDSIAVRKLGQRQDCFPYWQESWIRFLRASARWDSSMCQSWATVYRKPHYSQLQQSLCMIIRKLWSIRHKNQMAQWENGAHQQRGDKKSWLSASNWPSTCCIALWWISGCHCSGPTGKQLQLFNFVHLECTTLSQGSPVLAQIHHFLINTGHQPLSTQRLLEFHLENMNVKKYIYNKGSRSNYTCYYEYFFQNPVKIGMSTNIK